jgi:hypothetical protein
MIYEDRKLRKFWKSAAMWRAVAGAHRILPIQLGRSLARRQYALDLEQETKPTFEDIFPARFYSDAVDGIDSNSFKPWVKFLQRAR